jgi:hypothetical protein
MTTPIQIQKRQRCRVLFKQNDRGNKEAIETNIDLNGVRITSSEEPIILRCWEKVLNPVSLEERKSYTPAPHEKSMSKRTRYAGKSTSKTKII